ncbi:MAG: hypothetical protein P1U39_06605 [Legionellaceae bacterium]|nr:hypothetical protein [Legionellaceae bacterium]
MKPIILFFEDHRDPIAKDILSQNLAAIQALEINTLALEFDQETSAESHRDALLHYCKQWSKLQALPDDQKEKMLRSASHERQEEFLHNIANLPARKAELALILRAKHTALPIQIKGFDLNLGDIRTLTPEQQLRAARAMQIEREQAMTHHLAAFNEHGGVAAILGLSHVDVANQLKQQGRRVVCFLPVSMTQEEGVQREFLDKIAARDTAVQDFIILDRRTHAMSELLCIIESTVQAMQTELTEAPRPR